MICRSSQQKQKEPSDFKILFYHITLYNRLKVKKSVRTTYCNFIYISYLTFPSDFGLILPHSLTKSG